MTNCLYDPFGNALAEAGRLSDIRAIADGYAAGEFRHYDTLAGAQSAAVSGAAPVGAHVTVYRRAIQTDGGGFAGVVEASDSASNPGGGRIRPVNSVVDPRMWGAIGDGVADDTAALNAALEFSALAQTSVWLPRGLYLVDPATSVILPSGVKMIGDGPLVSQLVAKPVGGSVLRREWSASGANAYARHMTLRDFGVILRHPATADPSNYAQIGLNLRHITRSAIENLYIGNYPSGVSSQLSTPAQHADGRQGIGVLLGTTSAQDPAYSGGEANTVRKVVVTGARKGFSLDDPDFSSPGYSSAAHATNIIDCEAQIVEQGLMEHGQYNTGSNVTNFIAQAVDNMRGSTEGTYGLHLTGVAHTVIGGYAESDAGATDYEVYLSATSRRCRIYNRRHQGGAWSDLGSDNVVEQLVENGDWSLTVNRVNISNSLPRASVRFSAAGGSITLLSSHNVAQVVRNTVGDYTIFFPTGLLQGANYSYALSGSPSNASKHAGVVYPRDAAAVGQTQIRVVARNVVAGSIEDFGDVSCTIFGDGS